MFIINNNQTVTFLFEVIIDLHDYRACTIIVLDHKSVLSKKMALHQAQGMNVVKKKKHKKLCLDLLGTTGNRRLYYDWVRTRGPFVTSVKNQSKPKVGILQISLIITVIIVNIYCMIIISSILIIAQHYMYVHVWEIKNLLGRLIHWVMYMYVLSEKIIINYIVS